MELNVMVNEIEFESIKSKILNINEYITLYIQDDIGYIADGIIKKEDAYYFGKVAQDRERYQLLPLKFSNSQYIIEPYNVYLNVVEAFVEICSNIGIIKLVSYENEESMKMESFQYDALGDCCVF